MASARILQRAETAMEIADDFLFADDDEDDDDDDEADCDDSEKCCENVDAEHGEGIDRSNATEHEEPESKGKDDARADNTSDSGGQKGGGTKKSQKGVGKKLKSLMGVAMRPFGSKLQWKLDFNFEASNKAATKQNGGKRNDQSNSDNATGRKKTTRSPNDDRPSSSNAAEKRLQMENRRLEKLADKFLDAYIQLKTRIGELSEVEGQLEAARNLCDKLKEELQVSQSNLDGVLSKMAKASEAHRVEVDRLGGELKKAKKDIGMLEQDKQSNESHDKTNKEKLLSLKKELEILASVRDKLTSDLSKRDELHRAETSRLTKAFEHDEIAKSEMIVQLRETKIALERDVAELEKRVQTCDMENMRLQHKIRELEHERDTLRATFSSSTDKINELRRAIAILESDPSTSTTVDPATKGSFSCPLCGLEFASLATMQLHAEDCCT